MKEKQHDPKESLKRGFKATPLDSPSGDFTQNLMSKIHALDNKTTIQYSSLIPNPVKISLGLIFACIIAYVSMGSEIESTSLLSTYINLPELAFNLPDFAFNIEFSNVILYGLVFFMILFFIQIYFVKTKLNQLKF